MSAIIDSGLHSPLYSWFFFLNECSSCFSSLSKRSVAVQAHYKRQKHEGRPEKFLRHRCCTPMDMPTKKILFFVMPHESGALQATKAWRKAWEVSTSSIALHQWTCPPRRYFFRDASWVRCITSDKSMKEGLRSFYVIDCRTPMGHAHQEVTFFRDASWVR